MMRMGAAGAAVLVAALMALSGAFAGIPGADASHQTPSGGPPATASPAATPAAPPPPSVACATGYPTYGLLPGGIAPLDPDFNQQGNCPLFDVDEMHASFTSNAPDSGSRWTTSWNLPATANGVAPATLITGLYVGEVVTGDANSSGGQSYLEVFAAPNATTEINWSISVAVLSLLNVSHFSKGVCPTAANLSWQGHYYCEWDDLPAGKPFSLPGGGAVPGGTTLQVTFAGIVNGTAGTDLWINDSAHPAYDGTWQLNKAKTGNFTFEPAFGDSCIDTVGDCWLSWGVGAHLGSGWGLGFGATACPYQTGSPSCNSYNSFDWSDILPSSFGTPLYWNSTGYTGQYRYFVPQSASAVCSTIASTPVATCYNTGSGGGNGFYPSYSLNATGLSFGAPAPGPNTTFGGADEEFPTQAPVHFDTLPFAFTALNDSSRAGYVPPGHSLAVAAAYVDLGTVLSSSIAYSQNGSAWVTAPMTLTAGPASAPSYAATIPSGPNGKIVYYVNGTNGAGAELSSGARSVLRDPPPHYAVTLRITEGSVPSGCFYVTVNGTEYSNGGTALLAAGVYSIIAYGCYPYQFAGWSWTTNVAVSPMTASVAAVTVQGAGVVTANWNWVRPSEDVYMQVNVNQGCASILINGTAVLNESTVAFLYGISYQLLEKPICSGIGFAGWRVTNDSDIVILGPSITVYGNGTLTATYLAGASSYAVTFFTSPAGCGGIAYSVGAPGIGAGYISGDSVLARAGSYYVAPLPCQHYGFTSWNTTGGLSTTGPTVLTVSGSGTLTEENYHLTEITIYTSPAGCGGIWIGSTQYGNGAVVSVKNDSVYTVLPYSCSGYYLESVGTSPGLYVNATLLTVRWSGNITVYSLPGTPTAFVGFQTVGCGGIVFGDFGEFGNGGYVSDASPGATYSLSTKACAEYGFAGWTSSGEIQITGFSPAIAWVNGSGSIEATFTGVFPVFVGTEPSNCGAVVIAGTAYPNDGTATLTAGLSYSISTVPCAYYVFQQYAVTGASVANGTISIAGGATVTAVFVPATYPVTVAIAGTGSGTVKVAGQAIAGSTVLNPKAGTYSLATQAASGSTFGGWIATGSVSVAGSTLYVNGSGTLTADFALLPLTVTLQVPTSGDVGLSVLLFAQVAIPLGGSYSYLWNFGDQSSATTTANATSHTWAATGSFTVTVTVIDPYHREANASGAIQIVTPASGFPIGTYLPGLLALVAALVVIAGVVLYNLLRRDDRPKP